MLHFTDEPTIKDYAAALRRHGWLTVVTVAIALAIGIWQAFLVAPTWKATATVLADTSTTDTRDYVDRADVPEVARVMETLASQVLTTSHLEKLVDELHLYPTLRATKTPEQLATRMRSAISTEVKGFDTFQVSFVYGDREIAAQVANRLASDLLTAELDARRSAAAKTSALLNDQIASASASLKSRDEALRKFRSESTGVLPGQTEGNIRAVERWQTELRGNAEALTRARERLSLAVAATPKIFQGEDIQALRAEVKALEQNRTAIQEQIDAEQKLVARSGEVEGKLATLQTEYNSALATYNDLLKRRQDVSVRAGLDETHMKDLFRLVEPARAPLHPFRPVRPLVMGIALAAGLLLGILLALAADYFDETFDDPILLGKHAGVPVLAAVPRARVRGTVPPAAGRLHS